MVAPTRRLLALGTFLLLVVLFLVPATIYAEGNSPDAVTIGDFVWREDRYAHDGIQQPGEPGLPFAPVNLYVGSISAANLISTTNADSNGYYSLDVSSLSGNYIIQMPNPAHPTVLVNPPSTYAPGLLVSPQNQGGNDTIDSDIDPSSRSALISIGAATDTSIDAGVYNHPNTVTYCTGRQLSPTFWMQDFSLLKADPSLGTLKGAYIRASAGAAQNVTVRYNGTGTLNGTLRTSSQTLLSLPDDPDRLLRTLFNTPLVLGAGQSITITDIVHVNTFDKSYTVDYAQFIGDGGFDDYFLIPAESSGHSEIIGGGNETITLSTRTYISICVTYVFEDPLAVTLNSFDAQCREESEIDVAWETAQETDMLGFNVLRAVSAEGTPEQVNSELIPAQAPGGSGSNYLWQDASLSESGEYFYWLDAVEIDGSTERFGPVSAAIPCAPTAVTIAALESGSGAPIAPALGALGVMLAGLVALRLRRR